MIDPKILFIVFGVIACASVISLILYDQYESNLEWQDKGGPLIAQDSELWLEKVLQNCTQQRLAKSMNYTTPDDQQIIINSNLIEFHNSTHHIDNINCELVVFTDYDEDFTDDFEIDYTEKFD